MTHMINAMGLLGRSFPPVMGEWIYWGGGGLGLILVIVVIVLLLRK